MASSPNEVTHDFYPFFRVYKDGRVERFNFNNTDFVTPSEDPNTGVRSKDVIISPETHLSVRLYLPKTTDSIHKLPLLIYIHGGAFCIESAFSSNYHYHLNSLVAEANVVAVSVEYRLAPEHPIPACYEDAWAVTKWVASHASGSGPEPWINNHADLTRVFVGGDSAGANIAHNTVVQAGVESLGSGVEIVGMVLVHPFFGDGKPDRIWMFICPDTSGCDDPRLNPAAHPGLLSKLACRKVLVYTAEADGLKGRGWSFYEALKKSGWEGVVEMEETDGEDHVFHLRNPTCEKAQILIKRVASFFNQ